MNKSLFTLFITFIMSVATTLRAEVIYTTVFNVIESKKSNELLVLSAADGRVYRTQKTDLNLKRMKSFIGSLVQLESYGSKISSIRKTLPNEVNQQEFDTNHFRYNELREFAPTNLKSLSEAKELFNTMLNDGDKRKSQCFKRAHIWAYDMWSKLGIKSQKIFLFYTERYYTIDDFEWWFHVAPVVTVDGVDYVLDGTFTEAPMTVPEWKSFFMKSEKINCPEITHYSQYKDHQWNKLCYLMKTSMYQFRPDDIMERDYNGVKRNHWILEELQDARRAFKDYEKTYEGLDTGKPTITY